MKGKRGKGLTAFQGWTSENLMRTILNKKPVFWLLLSIPAVLMLSGYWRGRIDSTDMLHPTGEWSARLMIIAMTLGPLAALIGPKPWLKWLLARRRAIGVGAFGYAVLHTIFYLIDMGNVDDILAEWWTPGIWTAWAAMLLFVPIALTSNDAAMRALRSNWKNVQRLVYAAAVLTILHWFWVDNEYRAAIVHFAPLILLWIAVFAKPFFSPKVQSKGI
jgi:methionine sulfoxide reductase heme-binding subunit